MRQKLHLYINLSRKELVRLKIDKRQKPKLLYPEVQVEDGYIGMIKKTKEEEIYFEKIAKEIKIVEVRRNIDTGEISYILEFQYSGKTVKTELQRGELTKTKILKLAALGADVFDHNVTIIIKHLNNQEVNAPKVNVHEGIGWTKVDGKDVFRHYHAIGIESKYIGNLNIKPKGGLTEYLKLLRDQVCGHTPLETMIAIGLSSIVIGHSNKSVDINCLFTHIAGESSQGKTTACQLAISTTGYPDVKQSGLMRTWNGTTNAIVSFLKDNNGLPVVIDEASMSKVKDFTELIYIIAGGKEKDRLNKDAELKESSNWNTSIISNGELMLSSKSKQNTGLRMRLKEFSEVEWTKSAEHSEAIKKGILENHGHLAPLMAEALLKIGKEELTNRIEKWRGNALQLLNSNDKFATRLTIKIGVIMATAEIANDTFEVDFDLKAMLEFLVEHEIDTSESRDIYTRAYEYFLETVAIQHHKFNTFTRNEIGNMMEPNIVSQEQWGKIEHLKEGKREINIVPNAFNKIMEAGGFEDPKIILKGWKKMKLLSCDSDRLTRKRKLNPNSQSIDLYVILAKQEKTEDDDTRVVKQRKAINKMPAAKSVATLE